MRAWLIAVLLVTAIPLGMSAHAQQAGRPSQVAPQARQTLNEMCRLLRNTKNLQVEGDSSIDVVLATGERVQFNASSKVSVSRPTQLRSERVGPLADMLFLYDGKSFVFYDRTANTYACSQAPANLDAALDDARERLGLEAPGADLLYSDVCEGLMQDVTSLTDIGTEVIDGVRTRHLVARGKTVDWQLWIEEGGAPLPKKYVITTKDQAQFPQFQVVLKNWNLSPTFAPDFFVFRAAPGAKQVAFLPSPQSRGVGGAGSQEERP